MENLDIPGHNHGALTTVNCVSSVGGWSGQLQDELSTISAGAVFLWAFRLRLHRRECRKADAFGKAFPSVDGDVDFGVESCQHSAMTLRDPTMVYMSQCGRSERVASPQPGWYTIFATKDRSSASFHIPLPSYARQEITRDGCTGSSLDRRTRAGRSSDRYAIRHKG